MTLLPAGPGAVGASLIRRVPEDALPATISRTLSRWWMAARQRRPRGSCVPVEVNPLQCLAALGRQLSPATTLRPASFGLDAVGQEQQCLQAERMFVTFSPVALPNT